MTEHWPGDLEGLQANLVVTFFRVQTLAARVKPEDGPEDKDKELVPVSRQWRTHRLRPGHSPIGGGRYNGHLIRERVPSRHPGTGHSHRLPRPDTAAQQQTHLIHGVGRLQVSAPPRGR